MKVCSKCVLPETFPGVSFDNQGLCIFCQIAEKSPRDDKRPRLEKRFLEVIDQVRGMSLFDCVVAYSGGKDSSYLLDLLVSRYDLKVLAVTFDNWFLSEMAFHNIRAITKSLNVGHMVIRPPYELMKGLFSEASNRELYPKKSLERASTICTACMSFVRFVCIRTAIEKDIPLVAFGFHPGQIPENAAIVKTNAALLKSFQQAIYDPISSIVKDAARPFFLEEKHFASKNQFPYIANPFALIDYREEDVFLRIRQMGWKRVNDTDENSTNCLLNSYSNLIHYRNYKYHPYASEIANMVRKGQIDRDEGLRRLHPPRVNRVVRAIAKLLND